MSRSAAEVADMMASAFEVMAKEIYNKGFDDGVKEAQIESLQEYIEELENEIDELDEELEDDQAIIDTLAAELIEKAYQDMYGQDDVQEILGEIIDEDDEPVQPQPSTVTTFMGFTADQILKMVKMVDELEKAMKTNHPMPGGPFPFIPLNPMSPQFTCGAQGGESKTSGDILEAVQPGVNFVLKF